MSVDNREIVTMWRVYRTLHQMCSDRGYLVSQNELERDINSFSSEFAPRGKVNRSHLTFVVQKRNDPASRTIIFFPGDNSVGIKLVKYYIERMIDEHVCHCIIVYRKTITLNAKRVISQVTGKYRMESFQELDLVCNVTEHELVPKHIVLTDEEKGILLKKYRIKETQLPQIEYNDPIARYYSLLPGQVVQIIRPSKTTGRYATYRICKKT